MRIRIQDGHLNADPDPSPDPDTKHWYEGCEKLHFWLEVNLNLHTHTRLVWLVCVFIPGVFKHGKCLLQFFGRKRNLKLNNQSFLFADRNSKIWITAWVLRIGSADYKQFFGSWSIFFFFRVLWVKLWIFSWPYNTFLKEI